MDALFGTSRLAGILLAGAGLVGVVLVGPTAFIPPAIWTGPQGVSLRLIAEHRRRWRVANAGFIVATILTSAGLFVLPSVVGTKGSSLATAAAVAFALAGGLWLVTLAIRISVTPSVAAGYLASGVVDPAFAPLAKLGSALFIAFVTIGSAALVPLGGAIILGGVLGDGIGWGVALAGIAIVASYLRFGDTLPAFVYMPTTAVGIALLIHGG